MTNDEAKSVLFDMLGKGIYVKNTKENQAILAALRALEQDTKEIYNKGFADGQKALAEHLKLCKEEQGWIPVNERLPDTDDDVLVCDGADMFVAWYAQKGMWQGWNSHDCYFERDTQIIAWMPLPEPYRAESEKV